jgi:hypothetical protein
MAATTSPAATNPSDDGQLAARQETREGRHALRVWVDEREPAARELRGCASEVVWVKAVLRESTPGRMPSAAGLGLVLAYEARAVDGGALHALAKVRVGRRWCRARSRRSRSRGLGRGRAACAVACSRF